MWRVLGKWAGWIVLESVGSFCSFVLASTQAYVTCILVCRLLCRPFTIVGLSCRGKMCITDQPNTES